MNKIHRMFLIDGTAIAYRAHFALIRNPLYTRSGIPTSAIFGFFRSLFKLLRDEQPEYIAVAFDAKEKTFRHKMYPDYKATREKMPDELREQMPVIREVLEKMDIPTLIEPGYEADDVIGTIAAKACSEGMDVYMVTGDKDFMQMINDRISMYKPGTSSKNPELVNADTVVEKMGVTPEKVIDLLALTGDTSDNVPGVKGIGSKTAAKLLSVYTSIEDIYDHLDAVSNKRIRTMLQENEAQARLSKELVTIRQSVPVTIDFDNIRFTEFDSQSILPVFEQYELFSLIRELQKFSEKGETADKVYQPVDTPEKFRDFISNLGKTEIVAFDTETTGTDPLSSRLVGVSFSWEKNRGYYIPLLYPEKGDDGNSGLSPETVLLDLKPVLENPDIGKIGQNLKFDIQVLAGTGILVQGLNFDTMIAAFLLDPDSRSYKLDLLSQKYLGYIMQPIEDLIGKKGPEQLSMAEIPKERVSFYSAEDAEITFQLYEILKPKLEEASLTEVFEKIEIPLIPVLSEMEIAGVYVNQSMLETQSEELGKEIDLLLSNIHKLAGKAFNVNSPKQLSEILFEELGLPRIRKNSTDVNVLEKLKHKHELPARVLEYRTLMKLKNTYLDALPKLINPDSGRIHTSFNQTVAATGRLSSSNPNFQNIPIRTELGREIRKAFVPQNSDDFILSADYSQIELRIMAHLSGDKNLRKAFEEGVDVHAQTAGIVYGVPIDDVLPEMRRVAKVVNFGIMYGAGPFRLSGELSIPLEEAESLINDYFEKFSGINRFIADTIAFAKQNQYVVTISKRRRYLPDINAENRRMREAAERVAINMPIQGSAADMIKIAMINIHRQFREEKLDSRMILQIHDELVFEVSAEEMDRVREIVKVQMEKALPLDVPVVVDMGAGKSWYEAH